MNYEAEDPTWHLFTLRLPMSCPGSPNHIPCKCDMFPSRWSIAVPLNTARLPEIRGPSVERSRRITERESCEIGFNGKDPVVAPAYVTKDDGSRIRGQEVIKDTHKRLEGCYRERLQPLHEHHLAIAYMDTSNENFETTCENGGVKVGEFHHLREVIQGRKLYGFAQGRLEHPRDTPQVQGDCVVMRTMRPRRGTESACEPTIVHYPTGDCQRLEYCSHKNPSVSYWRNKR